MNDVFEGNVGDKFVRLKPKMHSMKILMVKNLIQQKE